MVTSRKRPTSPLTSSPGVLATPLLLQVTLMIIGRVSRVAGQQVCDSSSGAPLCSCTVDGGIKTVDCSGLNLVNVPSGIPDDTNILNLSENLIEGLESRVFANLVELRQLYLIRNSIRTDRLNAAAFEGLGKLRLLDLGGNELQLQEESHVQPFLPLLRLRHLDLANNNIATIHTSFVTVLDRLQNLFMVSNPLVCDCNLIWFKNWLLNKGTQPDFSARGVQCFTPESVSRQAVATAWFCIPVQRCYFCDSAASNAACNLTQQQCSGTDPACQNEVRINNGRYLISKSCQALDACLTNAEQSQNDCNDGTENSVCRYCCQGDRCNAPESTILAGYQFPFPNTLPSTGSTPTGQIPTSAQLPTTPKYSTSPPTSTTTLVASTNPTPVLQTSQPSVSRCPAEETQGETGVYLWPETLAGDIAILPCTYDLELESATRLCGDGSSGWNEPITSECPTASSILRDLSNVNINRDNALEVSQMLTDVTSVSDVLQPEDVSNAVNTFENLANALASYEEDSPDVFGNAVDTVDQLAWVPNNQLVESQVNDDASSRLLRSIDAFNLGVQFQSNVLEEDTPSIDVVLVDISDPMDNGLFFFGAGQDLGHSHPKVVSDAGSNTDTVIENNKNSTDEIVKGSIFLPNSLLTSVGDHLSRVQFVMYEETTFFDVIQTAARNRTLSNEQETVVTIPTTSSAETTDAVTNTTVGMTTLPADCIAVSCLPGFKTIINSVVISAAVGDLNITDLDEPAVITFRKGRRDADNAKCVFWNESENGGWGGWSTEGCSLESGNDIDDSNVVCKCNHLTNFALLMDIYDGPPVSPGDQLALSIISYVGCTLSLIGLILTLITYTCCGPRSRAKVNVKKFSGDKHAKVLVNFVVSLILVNIFFIAGALTAEFRESVPDEFCAAMGICLHFSLLDAMAWMVIQAFNMYMALVKVFATYYSHFMLKMMIIGWGIPLAIVAITIGVDLQNYGSSSGLCWLNGLAFYLSFLLPVCLVLVFNIVVFVAVSWKLCRLRRSKISTSDRFNVGAQLRATMSMTVLLGLTWILAFFAIGEASLTFSYLFAAFNSLQGFALFFFQCLLQPEMRQRWVQTCCPSCAPERSDSKSGVFSSSRNQTTKAPNNNLRKQTASTTAGSSYIDNPAYEGVSHP